MATTVSFPTLDASVLLNYYNAKLPLAASQVPASPVAASSTNSATANDSPPWDDLSQPTQQAEDAQILATTNFVDVDNANLTTGSSASAKTEQDNQKLFALYQGVKNLSYLASMAQRDGMTAGQLAGYNTRFQAGLQQIESFVSSTSFNDLTLQAGTPSASVASTVSIPFASFGYTGGTVVSDANVENPLPGVSADESFDIAVTKGGTTTDVPIDLSQVQGGLTLDNIVNYANQQLSADGFATRLQRVFTEGSSDDPTTASYGISINASPGEQISLSSAAATPALYVAGNSGSAVATSDGTAADQQGRLVKLTDLSSAPQGVFNATANPTTGNTTAQSTVVDAQGNVYVVGNATGDFGNQLNQGSQDVYLSKYDSAGNLQWTSLVGSAGTASAYSLALNPTGGVVVAGSTTADLTTAAIADGNSDSFVTSYDAAGDQDWTTQIPTLNNNQAMSVSVDSTGTITVGGQVTGVIGAGQTSAGGSDAYLATISAKGQLTAENQFGTTGNDQVVATASTPGATATADGGLIVASVQNGDAILSKYAGGDITQAPVWQMDLGSLQNGAIGGLTVSGNQIYVSGTTANASLTAGGAATVANASSGGTDAFVFSATDNGTTATPDQVSYVGTSGADKGGAVAVGGDGTVYLTGTTTGTFAGQTRNVAGVNNMFVSALNPDGTIAWTRQYGGADGQSTGAGIALDAQGSSVLDALGLPRGAVTVNQSVDLTSQSTLRAGDTFGIDIAGTAARNITITVDQGETLESLTDKINAELQSAGTASVTFANGGEALQIKVNAGVTATLVPGPADSDALARLGIAAGTLTSAPAKGSAAASTTATPSSTSNVFGLGLTGTLDISTQAGAGAARATLENVINEIPKIYQAINAPPASASTPTTSTSAPVSGQLQAQIANYNLALSLLTGSSGSSSSSSSTA
ncbi:MAG TPA: hypothetical protein VN932_12865 [Rhizomicrobium sp.]|nr:hypothetical protein [Rhizomicrobium sp.]